MDLRERGGTGRRHPWELARGRFVRSVLHDHVQWSKASRILDVGAGDGWLATELITDSRPGTSIVCWDVNYTEGDLREPLPHQVARVSTSPEGTFDLVLLLDVLEHIEDDGRFLDDCITPRLGPDGVLMITVPAHPSLYVEHDRALAHVRRYKPTALRELVAARYDIVAGGGLFASLLVPRAASALAERLGKSTTSAGVGQWTRGDGTTALLARTLGADARVGYWFSKRGHPLPGLTAWIVARPRGTHT